METEDVILRSWRESDAEALYEMCFDDALRKSGIGFYDSIADSLNIVRYWKNNVGFKVIVDGKNDFFVGFISLSDMGRYNGNMEMEYAVAAGYRNSGYATRAVKYMLDCGFG